MRTGTILDPDVECSDDHWPAQQHALQATLHRLARDPAHREKWAPWSSAALTHRADLARLPFTNRAELHVHPPLSDHCVPRSELVRIHASSGTTGMRTLSGYTRADIHLWTHVVARGLAALGVDRTSLVYSTLAHGLFTGGLGFHQAASALGATVIPGGQARSVTHADLLRRLGPTVLFATPSYALHLLDRHGPLPSVALGVFGAEPWTEADRTRLETGWGMTARDTYGLSEVIGPGVAFECGEANGLHINVDHFVPEIIDEAGNVLPDGEWGELVLSAPTRQARPLLRYRTGDRTRLDSRPCSCGRTLPRMARIAGRVDDMKVVRGVNVHPQTVAAVLDRHAGVFGAWRLVLRRPGALDVLTLQLECPSPDNPELAEHLEAHLIPSLVLTVRVELHPPGALPHTGGKAARWADLRDTERPDG